MAGECLTGVRTVKLFHVAAVLWDVLSETDLRITSIWKAGQV